MDGTIFIREICKLLNNEGVLLYDSNIKNRIKKLSKAEFEKIVSSVKPKKPAIQHPQKY